MLHGVKKLQEVIWASSLMIKIGDVGKNMILDKKKGKKS
jgi:hypothetical protein